MRIGLAGTVSVGKSTLAKALGEIDTFKDYLVQTERSKYLRDQGIALNTDSTLKGQIVFAAERSIELLNENIITDRTIYDVCSFTLSANSIDWNVKEKFVDLMMRIRDDYDVIVYVSPEGVEIEDNGVRTVDSEYRDKIDFTITEMLKAYPPKRLIEVSGTTEERINKIKEALSV
jgi:nicotinamide riboside kinase